MHDSDEYAPIFYYLGTGYGTLASHQQKSSDPSTKFAAKEYRKLSLYNMRKALALLEQMNDSSTLLLPVYNNYANELDACSRVIEALRVFCTAMKLDPTFGMAIGNYGRVLNTYANMVNDEGHYRELHCYAYQAIKQALNKKGEAMHEEAVESFRNMMENYESLSKKEELSAPIVFGKYNL